MSRLVIKRADVVAVSLVSLLVITIVAVLYLAKAFFLPIVTAFIVGTMLAPAAGYLERHKIPRAFSAVMIVALAGLSVTFMVGLIAAPVMEWSTRLPELSGILKEKMQLFERPLELFRQLQAMLGGPQELPGASFQLPKIEWMQPTLEFVSPTLTEFLLFLATLVLFIATWPDLRRKAVMVFAEHDARLRTLANSECDRDQPERLPHHGDDDQRQRRHCHRLICWAAGMPNPAGFGALAAVLNFFPIIGPVVMFIVLTAVGIIAFPTLGSGARRADGLRRHDVHGRPFRDAGHRRSPVGIECACRLSCARILDVAVGADGRLSGVSDPDRRACAERAFASRYVAAIAANMKPFRRGTSSLRRRLCATKPVAS